MLQISNLTKSFGARTLFQGVSFSISPGERIGLVGRNGCGKSTLFRILLSEESLDEGTISAPRGYRIGHLAQHLSFTSPTILEEACLGLPEDERDQQYRGEIILAGLGFREEEMSLPPSHFSGGFQIRINLAKLLLSEPNLLLLDEPTNYLDIVSVRWLANFLRSWRNELVMISHDRGFLDSVTTHSMLIHRGTIKKLPGSTTKLYEQIALDEAVYEKTRLNEERKRKELQAFVDKNRARASTAALAQSKLKALQKLGQREELRDGPTLDFNFRSAPFRGKQLLEVKNLGFSYPEGPRLIEGLTFSVAPGDRIGVIGKNGKGKSTLLRLLAQELAPSNGSVAINENAKLGYFGQTNIARLNPALSIEDEVLSANPTLHRTAVRNICGTMMFPGDDALKRIAVLSGGERSRVQLGKIIAQPSNLLLLDEPTNHLDMESIEALIEALREYQGAVLVVTHSELILNELATRLIVFQDDGPMLFDHEYAYFLDKVGWGDEEAMSGNERGGRARGRSKKADRQARGKQVQERSRLLGPLEKKINVVEERICALEKDQAAIEHSLASASLTGNASEIARLSQQLRDVQSAIDARFEELEQLTREHDQLRKSFEAPVS